MGVQLGAGPHAAYASTHWNFGKEEKEKEKKTKKERQSYRSDWWASRDRFEIQNLLSQDRIVKNFFGIPLQNFSS